MHFENAPREAAFYVPSTGEFKAVEPLSGDYVRRPVQGDVIYQYGGEIEVRGVYSREAVEAVKKWAEVALRYL